MNEYVPGELLHVLTDVPDLGLEAFTLLKIESFDAETGRVYAEGPDRDYTLLPVHLRFMERRPKLATDVVLRVVKPLKAYFTLGLKLIQEPIEGTERFSAPFLAKFDEGTVLSNLDLLRRKVVSKRLIYFDPHESRYHWPLPVPDDIHYILTGLQADKTLEPGRSIVVLKMNEAARKATIATVYPGPHAKQRVQSPWQLRSVMGHTVTLVPDQLIDVAFIYPPKPTLQPDFEEAWVQALSLEPDGKESDLDAVFLPEGHHFYDSCKAKLSAIRRHTVPHGSPPFEESMIERDRGRPVEGAEVYHHKGLRVLYIPERGEASLDDLYYRTTARQVPISASKPVEASSDLEESDKAKKADTWHWRPVDLFRPE